MTRYALSAAALVALCASLVPAEDKKPDAPKDGFKPMFNGKNLDGWVNVNCHPDTFFVKGDEIITTGKPTGFLRTDRQYENFVMEFDWMHVEKEKMANSGLFVWGDPLPAVGTGYTRGIEVQVLINFAPKDGWATSHGDIFSIWGAKCVPDRVHPVNPKMERCLPSENRVKGGGEWNHYKVTANDGVIKLEVNGKEVSGVSKCNPRKGYLALESEGVECHFKNLKIKELPSTNPKPEECAKVAEGHVSLFNGRDLKGWWANVKPLVPWRAADGRLIAPVGSLPLLSDRTATRGELVFDWKPAAKLSTPVVTLGPITVQISPEGEVSYAFDDKTAEKPVGGKEVAVKPKAWNRGVVAFDGKTVVVTVNGAEAVRADVAAAEGKNVIALRTAADEIEFMNVFFRELKEEKK